MVRLLYFQLVIFLVCHVLATAEHLTSKRLCNQCSACDVSRRPPSEAYPHMTAWDDSLIAGALQSDCYYLRSQSLCCSKHNRRFSNYMDKCSEGQSYLSVDNNGAVSLRALSSLNSLAQADWKSINPPQQFNHRSFRFWLNGSTGKCLTVLKGMKEKRTVGIAECQLNGSNPFQLFAFRFHYHKAFCCCGLQNE